MPDRAARDTQDFTETDIAAVVERGHSVLRIVRNGRLTLDQARLSWTDAQAYDGPAGACPCWSIMEYEGGLSREEAEWQAFLCVQGEA